MLGTASGRMLWPRLTASGEFIPARCCTPCIAQTHASGWPRRLHPALPRPHSRQGARTLAAGLGRAKLARCLPTTVTRFGGSWMSWSQIAGAVVAFRLALDLRISEMSTFTGIGASWSRNAKLSSLLDVCFVLKEKRREETEERRGEERRGEERSTRPHSGSWILSGFVNLPLHFRADNASKPKTQEKSPCVHPISGCFGDVSPRSIPACLLPGLADTVCHTLSTTFNDRTPLGPANFARP